MEVNSMTTNNTNGNNERYVITNDGIRMSYEEYIEMIKAERN